MIQTEVWLGACNLPKLVNLFHSAIRLELELYHYRKSQYNLDTVKYLI